MRFLTDDDYGTLIREEIRNTLITDFNDPKLWKAENMAVSQLKNYLSGRYDLEAVFVPPADPDPRDAYIVMIAVDLTLYHLYSSVAPNIIPEHRSQRYEDVLKWLRSVSTGDATANLPLVKNEEGREMSGHRIGSRYERQNHRW